MNKDYTFTVTAEEMNILSDAMVEMPFKKVADLYFKMQRQIQEQATEVKEEVE